MSLLARGRVRVGAASAKRRRAGGKLAAGRDSGTRDDLVRERAYVFDRARWRCELCTLRAIKTGFVSFTLAATDFAHVQARSQGGTNTRFNALATCNPCNLAMQGPYAKGRWLVTPVTVNGVRGFDVQLVKAAGKVAFRLGESETLAAGFIAADIAAEFG